MSSTKDATQSNNQDLAHKAKEILKDQGYDVKISHVYELFSKLSGLKDWNTAKAQNVDLSTGVRTSASDNLLSLAKQSMVNSFKGDMYTAFMEFVQRAAKSGEVHLKISQSELLRLYQLGLFNEQKECFKKMNENNIRIKPEMLSNGKVLNVVLFWGQGSSALDETKIEEVIKSIENGLEILDKEFKNQ